MFYYIVKFQKISILPHSRDWNFLGGGAAVRPKNLKRCLKLNWFFQWGGEFLEKIPSVGEVWIFSGITNSWKIELVQFLSFLFLTAGSITAG